MVRKVSLVPHSSKVPGPILSSGYWLCGVSRVLPVSVWVNSGFYDFLWPGVLLRTAVYLWPYPPLRYFFRGVYKSWNNWRKITKRYRTMPTDFLIWSPVSLFYPGWSKRSCRYYKIFNKGGVTEKGTGSEYKGRENKELRTREEWTERMQQNVEDKRRWEREQVMERTQTYHQPIAPIFGYDQISMVSVVWISL